MEKDGVTCGSIRCVQKTDRSSEDQAVHLRPIVINLSVSRLVSKACAALGVAVMATSGVVLLTTSAPKNKELAYARLGAGVYASGGYVALAGKW